MSNSSVQVAVNSIPSGLYMYYSAGSTATNNTGLSTYFAGATLSVPVSTNYYIYGFNGASANQTFTVSYAATTSTNYN